MRSQANRDMGEPFTHEIVKPVALNLPVYLDYS